MKKYKFTGETINFMGRILHRIEACRDFGSVKEGDIGGFIEKEENLDHYSTAWVSGNAKVFGNAWVSGNAKVFGNAVVYGSAEVFGNAMIYENAMIYGNARVSENAKVLGNAMVSGVAMVYGNARVSENALIKDSSDYFVVGPIGSRSDFTTFYKTTTGIDVICGCFIGSIDKFENTVKKTHGDNEHAKAYNTAIYLAKMIIKEETI